ncbi:hypothetical protein EX30DRAFT_32966 [Ascodesmis nigricans]|uniref:Uncharacterized protein n=1 Tax=Ascodesmis nigricans TaxID=341454 RepID=A0A4S2MWP3_9PEZI|nr:hypothetical protein EX30DRAFT_32966 [Ascodesmis nigricans]
MIELLLRASTVITLPYLVAVVLRCRYACIFIERTHQHNATKRYDLACYGKYHSLDIRLLQCRLRCYVSQPCLIRPQSMTRGSTSGSMMHAWYARLLHGYAHVAFRRPTNYDFPR